MNTYSPLYVDLPTPQEMSHWDQTTIATYGHPATMLMETASRGVLQCILDRYPPTPITPIVIYIGTGNNGGDGIALARHLHELGYQVMLLAVSGLDSLPSPAREHWEMAQKSQVPIAFIPADQPTFMPVGFSSPAIIVDALMGMGLNRLLTPFLQEIVTHINSFSKSATIIAMDIPSGLCGLTGAPLPISVEAHTTITFEALKPGLAMPHAHKYTGEVIVHSIGIPQGVKKSSPPSWLAIHPHSTPWLYLGQNLHKGSAGRVLVIGGSQDMEGAPALSTLGALRTGSGLVKIICPQGITQSLRPWGMEFLLQGIGTGSLWHKTMQDELLQAIEDFSPNAIVMGMGMGRNANVAHIVHTVLTMPKRCPVILDADALFALAYEKDFNVPLKKFLTEQDIITPHPLEAARLLPRSFYQFYAPNVPSEDLENTIDNASYTVRVLQQYRPQALDALCRETQAVTVLKGAGSLIKQLNTPTILAPYDIPALAVAGSGDVLAGIIASLVGKSALTPHLSPVDMASLGVYLHAQAGAQLEQTSPQGHLASEIAQTIPRILAQCISSPSPNSLPHCFNSS